jgi:peroxiredoxin (alkyl hydroperoxide reductase subunit C)
MKPKKMKHPPLHHAPEPFPLHSEDYDCPCCRPSMPLIGDDAPAFVAETTSGTIHFPEDYKGKWVILFSHPSDFTPVCTTEFMTFTKLSKEFKAMNAELIGLSIDSISSHVAWLYEIEQNAKFAGMKNIQVNFPLIADMKMDVAQKYGMIHPHANDTKTVRAVFFIDPEAKIRTILYYPSSTGRNFDELKRILVSLQISDKHGYATPADWKPGDDVIKSAAGTLSDAKKAAQKNKGKSCVWFLSLEPLSKKEVEDNFINPKNKKKTKK